MIRVIIRQRVSQPDYWYIDEVSGSGAHLGKICYKSLSEAREVAHKNHPYVRIEVE